MTTRPSQEKRDDENKLRWPILVSVALVVVLLVGLMLWLKPAVNPTVVTTEESAPPLARTDAIPIAPGHTESREQVIQSTPTPSIRQAESLAALAASEGMTEATEKAIHSHPIAA